MDKSLFFLKNTFKMRSNFYYINPISDRSILSLDKWNQNLTEARQMSISLYYYK